MEINIKRLIEQYMSSTGTKIIDLKSEKFISDFANWIMELQKTGKRYTDLLEYLELDYNTRNCAEVGKCRFDTVVKPFDTTIITPDADIVGVNKGRIITGNMKVYGSVPIIVKDELIDLIPSESIHTFMTQNPYTSNSILNWENLHNSGEANIIVGTYGSIHDKDTDDRIKLIESHYIEDYYTSNDSYFYVIGSTKKTKEKVLVKSLNR